MKLLLTLTLITVASVITEAQVKTGNTPAATLSVSTMEPGFTNTGFTATDVSLANNETGLSNNPNEKRPKTAPEKPGENDFTTNKFKVFLGFGNTNVVSDMVTLTNKSFVGELGWQIRSGVRLFENYELNFGVYGRQMPGASNQPQLSYNKFLGYSGALMYEFKLPGISHWGVPLGIEVLKYARNTECAGYEGKTYYHHYSALAFGPKIGLRYHVSKLFFVEAELEAQYEHFKSDLDWDEKFTLEANTISSFKFFGLSVNRCF